MSNTVQTSRQGGSTSSQTDVLQALGLLGSLPARSSEFSNEAYCIALDGVSRRYLFDAAKQILRGKLGHAFFPSPPEFRLVCDRIAQADAIAARKAREEAEFAGFMAERKELAKARTPEAKARIANMHRDFIAQHDEARKAQRTISPEQFRRGNPHRGKLFPLVTSDDVERTMNKLSKQESTDV